MKKDKDWLLQLGRTPTLEELQEHFRENDFSSAAVMDLDYGTLPGETVEMLEYIKGFMDESWEAHSREMGMRSSDHYGEDNPLIAMRDNLEDLVSSSVFKLITEHPENAAHILEKFDFSDPEIGQKVDAFLHNAVGKTMEVMDYPKLVQVMKELPTYEDFNHRKKDNQPGIDFHRKWYHTRTKTQMTSLEEMAEAANDKGEPLREVAPDPFANVEEQAISELKVHEFWASLNDDDKELLELKMNGMTTQEIADELGLKTHSAVVKRLQKLKKKFETM